MKYCMIVISLLLLRCQHPAAFEFESKWQSLNDPSTVIEFTEGKMILFKEGISLWSQATKNGELTYKLKPFYNSWYHFETFDGAEIFMKGRIETVTSKRIRFYFHKHHDILDVADEFYRTDDFSSYQNIMEKIQQDTE